MLRGILFEYVIPIAPALLLGITWIQVIRSKAPDDAAFAQWIPHLVATSSELYYWLSSLAPRQLLGGDYSDQRHHVISANLLAALLPSCAAV